MSKPKNFSSGVPASGSTGAKSKAKTTAETNAENMRDSVSKWLRVVAFLSLIWGVAQWLDGIKVC